MPSYRSDVQGIRIDAANGSLSDISRWVNDFDFGAAFTTLDDTGLSDTQGKTLPGLAEAGDVTLNGRLCSTTEAIFVPLANGTSVAKTLEIKMASGKFAVAEISPTNVRVRGTAKQLGTWSFAGTAVAGFNRTSVAAS